MDPLPTLSSGLTPSQSELLFIMVLVLTPISVVSSLFVFLTFTVFEEKRQVASWATTVIFVLSALVMDFLLLLGGAVGLDVLADPTHPFCKIQGTLLIFSGSTMITFFFVITLHLYLHMCYPAVKVRTRWLVAFGLVVPVIMTIPPLVADVIAFDGVWCFIESDETLYIYLNFYGPMGFACVAGAFMWFQIIVKMYRIMRQSSLPQQQQPSPPRSPRGTVNSSSEPNGQTEEEKAQLLAQQRQIVYRQIAFVTVFELIFFTFFANRISITVSHVNNFGGWIFHTFAMCTCGLFTFIIYGLKKSNFELWYDLFAECFGSRRAPGYQRF